MNQQEILNNMTKGNWRISDSPVQLTKLTKIPFKSIKNQSGIGGRILANAYGADLSKVNGKDAAEANAAAIVSAVNNTYGKGINPEGVEKMKIYCDAQEQWNERGQFEYEDGLYVKHISKQGRQEAEELLTRLRKEALTAAKL
jgi:hypothetical protein